MSGVKFYEEMEGLRGKDKYPSKELEEHLLDKIFPKTAEELAIELSNVTAGFFGFTLKHTGQQYGWDRIDSISKSLFRELGQLKTIEAIEKGVDVPKDARAPSVIFISALYTSSPEYNFEILKYDPEETVMRIFGSSRYFRIAKKLNIEKYISWPILIHFFEGIVQQMDIECKVEMETKKLENDGGCECLARFTLV